MKIKKIVNNIVNPFTVILFVTFLTLSNAEDFYKLLGIQQSASTKEIRQAFKKLAITMHPDKNLDDPEAHDKFLKINRAYEVLKDEELRKKYDLHGEDGLKDDFHGGNKYESWKFYQEEFGLYDDDKEIITLSRSDFEQSVDGTNDVWFINYYSPHCGHCHELAPTWREVARELEGVIRIGAINCEDDWQLCRMQGIRSYPTLMMYPMREQYHGERTTKQLVKHALKMVKSHVFELWSGNFDSTIKEENKGRPWLITFCGDGGDCLSTTARIKLAAILEDLVNVGTLSCHQNEDVCGKLGVEHGTYFYQPEKVLKDEGNKISSLNAQEIAHQVLSWLPDVDSLDSKTLKKIISRLKTGQKKDWLIHFVEGDGSQDIEFRKLPAMLDDVKIGRVDCRKLREECNELHLSKFPSFVVFKRTGGFELYYGRTTAHDVEKFMEKYPGSGIICMAIVDNHLVSAGSAQMKDHFVHNETVQNIYKEILLEQYSNEQDVSIEESGVIPLTPSVVIQTHVYDLDVGILRAIIAQAAGPTDSISNKDGRRNWYVQENCPAWWDVTGLPFVSVNQAEGKKHIRKVQLMTLVESYQSHCGVTPDKPKKVNKTLFTSRFIYTDMTAQTPLERAQEQEAALGTSGPGPSHGNHDTEASLETTDAEASLETTEAEAMETTKAEASLQTPESEPCHGTNEPEAEIGTPEPDVPLGTSEPDAKQVIVGIMDENISWEKRCLNVMKTITSWDTLKGVSDVILSRLPPFPRQLSDNWHVPLLTEVNERFRDFIPLSIGERKVLQASPNGNCIFNAVSIAMYGNEEMSMLLKLAAVVHMVDALIPFTKYIMEEFKRDINLWLTASTKSLVGEQPDPAEVEKILMTELLETIKKPYMDGSLFHLHMLTNLLQRPIQQHCIKKNFDSYRQMLFPPLGNIRNPSPIHLVWVPAKPRNAYATINHVVPAVCDLGVYGTHKEECAFLGLGVCAFTEGFNEDHSPGWVECTLCGQWVHDVCMDVSAKDYSQRDDFPCGCDILSNGVVQLKSASYYLSLKLNDIDLDFKEIVKKIDEKKNYRKDLFSREGHRIMKYSMRWGRFGPFTSDFIDDVNSHLIPFVPTCSRHLVPDVYMPEVLLQIITRREGINRLLAEMVLIQHSTTSHLQ